MNRQEPRKVYVVDDESVIAQTLATILNQSGFAARSFTNPEDALKFATGYAPDLPISDVMMPEMSGINLAIRLKAICPKYRVLLFSGQAATSDLLQNSAQRGPRLRTPLETSSSDRFVPGNPEYLN